MQRTCAFALGFTSLATQLLLMREFLGIFSGNELVIAIIFANWLLLTGIGSYLGRFIALKHLQTPWLFISLGIIPAIELFAVRICRPFFGIGLEASLQQIVLTSFLILLPFCLLNGFLFTCISRLLKDTSTAYKWESLGSFFGGALFSFVLVNFATSFQTAFVLLSLNLGMAAVILKRLWPIFFIPAALLLFSLELPTVSLEFPKEQVINHFSTRYGNIVITKSNGQTNYYENGLLFDSSNSTIKDEESVHYALAQIENPKRVLVISGGAGTVEEALKYNALVDYVELDPQLVATVFKDYSNEKVRLIAEDPRLFLKKTEVAYDAILVNLEGPVNGELNRFYTKEFFWEAKGRLKRSGLISFGLPGSADYMSPVEKQMNSAVFNTAKLAFKNSLIIPSDRNIYLMSDSNLTYNFTKRLPTTRYVNKFFLEGIITQDRIEYVKNALKENPQINTDFKPIAYYYYLNYWIEQFPLNLTLCILVLLGFAITYTLLIKPVQFVVFTTGILAIAMQFLILLGFQAVYGYAYYELSIIFTTFILGLAVGSLIATKFEYSKRLLRWTDIILVSFCFFLLLFFYIRPAEFYYPVIAFCFSVVSGFQFVIASNSFKTSAATTASKLYSADLFGSCLGAITIGIFVVPLFGIYVACIVLGALKLLSLLRAR